MKKITLLFLVAVFSILISGCGETVSGVGKDVSRMGKGVNTFFFRQPGSN